jgi:hypothetical protein
MTPEFVAEARRALAEVTAARQAAVEKTAAIRTRIDQSRSILATLTASRLEGRATEGDNAQFVIVSADIVALQAMLENAEGVEKAIDVHPAQEHLRTVEKALERELAAEAFNALTERAAKLDAALCDCVRDLHAAGLKAGRQPSLSMSWTPSEALANAIKHGRTP